MTMCVPSYIFLMLAAFVTGMQPNGHLNSYLNLMNFSPDGVTQKDFPRFPHRFGVKSPAETSTQIRNKYEDMLRNRRTPGIAEISADSLVEEEPWLGECEDPQKMEINKETNEDLQFRCNIWVPQGSKIAWYKGSELKKFYYYGSKITGMNLGRLRTVEKQPEYSTKGLMQTNYYIYCINKEDEGEYMLRIETPKGRTYERNFTLTVSGYPLAPRYCPEELRIEDFAKVAKGKEGEQVVLPCSSKGFVLRAWFYKENDRFHYATGDRFRTEGNGNLIIKNLSKRDSIFRCYIVDPAFERYDVISTLIQVI